MAFGSLFGIAILAEMNWFEVARSVAVSITDLGQWLMTHPVVAAGVLIGLAALYLALRLFLKLIWATLGLIIIVVVLLAGWWYFGDYLGQVAELNPFTRTTTIDRLIRELDTDGHHQLYHNPGESAGVVPSGFLTEQTAPDLSDANFYEGIRELMGMADALVGEVMYAYVTTHEGSEFWTEGAQTNDVNMISLVPGSSMKRELEERGETLKERWLVHTHPTAASQPGRPIPPSYLDVIGGANQLATLAMNGESLEYPPRLLVVQADRIWEYNVEELARDITPILARDLDMLRSDYPVESIAETERSLAEAKTAVTDLEPLYLCEGYERWELGELVKPCAEISDAEHRATVDAVLDIYESLGVSVVEVELPEEIAL